MMMACMVLNALDIVLDNQVPDHPEPRLLIDVIQELLDEQAEQVPAEVEPDRAEQGRPDGFQSRAGTG